MSTFTFLKTALESLIKKGMIEDVSDLQAQEQFYILVEELSKHNFTHYELSNFAKDGAFSINNSLPKIPFVNPCHFVSISTLGVDAM